MLQHRALQAIFDGYCFEKKLFISFISRTTYEMSESHNWAHLIIDIYSESSYQ